MKHSAYFGWLCMVALPAFADAPVAEESTSMLLIKTVAALIAVISLLFFLSWLVKKTPMIRHNKSSIKLTGSLSLGAKERVVSIEVGDKTLLLGVTATHISLLHTEQISIKPEVHT